MSDAPRRVRLPLSDASFQRARALPGGLVVVTDARGGFEVRGAVGALGGARRSDPAETFAVRRKAFLREGPSRHVLVLCERAPTARVMPEEVARAALARAFEGPSRHLQIELAGEDPLDAWALVCLVVELARRRARASGKRLVVTLATDLAAMTSARCAWLVERGVMLRVPFDGDEALHEAQRGVTGAAPFAVVSGWIGEYHRLAAARGVDATRAYLNAVLTLSRHAAGCDPRALVEACLRAGLRYVVVRPVEPFALAPEAYRSAVCAAEDFVDLRWRFIEAAAARTLGGELLVEKGLALTLERVLDGALDRSRVACGDGLATVAFTAEGDVHTCAEAARFEGTAGRLRVGSVKADGRAALVRHEALRVTQAASHLDGLPGCADCAYNPYCAVCAVHNVAVEGRLAMAVRGTAWCDVAMGGFDRLFAWIGAEAARVEALHAAWTRAREAVEGHYGAFEG